MPQAHQSGTEPRYAAGAPAPTRSLTEQVAEAVESRATPLSHLLRLMSALDDAAEAAQADALRLRLRARIGAPLSA